MNSRFTLSLVGAALFAGSAIAAPAHAEGAAEQRSLSVRFADLNLETAKGQSELNRRIRTAARNVCRANGGRSLSELMAENECTRVAMERSATQVAALVRQNALGG